MNHPSRLFSLILTSFALFTSTSTHADAPAPVIKAVIFDIGGVLLHSNKASPTELISKHTQIPASVVQETFKSESRGLSTGALTEEKFWEGYAAAHQGKLPSHWKETWENFYQGKTLVRAEMIELAKTLKERGYLTVILSNTVPSHHAVNLKRGLYTYFSHVFLSYQIKLMKPDVRAYAHVLRQLKISAQEAVMIDDRPANIDAAKKLGLRGIVFTQSTDLIDQLKSLGVQLTPKKLED